jgi:flagellar motor protein MotB
LIGTALLAQEGTGNAENLWQEKFHRDLVTVGYGKSKFKDPANPLAEANRRVQVVNMENKATAAK